MTDTCTMRTLCSNFDYSQTHGHSREFVSWSTHDRGPNERPWEHCQVPQRCANAFWMQ